MKKYTINTFGNMRNSLIVLLMLLITWSCDPCKRIHKYERCFPSDSIIITNTVIQKDSISFTKPDTMALSLLFECDSNNNVLMRELRDISSKGIQTKVIFKDNRLDVSGFVDSIAILNKLIETVNSKETSKINPINPQLKKDNTKLTNKVERLKLWLKIVSGVLLLIIAISVLVFKFK